MAVDLYGGASFGMADLGIPERLRHPQNAAKIEIQDALFVENRRRQREFFSSGIHGVLRRGR